MENPIPLVESAPDDLFRVIEENNDFWITTHVNPDGDSLASVLVFASLLTHLGKRHRLFLDDAVPAKYHFLPGIEQIATVQPNGSNAEPGIIVVLDSSSLDRIGTIGNAIGNRTVVVNIDHHGSNRLFGKVNWTDRFVSSTVEMVSALLDHFAVPISPELATVVYTGIVCDTGRFLFPNTSWHTLQVAADMVQKGAEPHAISENLYMRIPPQTFRLYAAVLSTLEFHFRNQAASIRLLGSKRPDSEDPDTEGFIDDLLSVEGIEVGLFFYEKQPEVFRVSFRSKHRVDVGALAQSIGGGGHARASGCTLKGSFDDVKERVLGILKPFFNNET
jgi:phosphoesterase RecJ-like protein